MHTILYDHEGETIVDCLCLTVMGTMQDQVWAPRWKLNASNRMILTLTRFLFPTRNAFSKSCTDTDLVVASSLCLSSILASSEANRFCVA